MIKYNEFVIIPKGESNILVKTDIEAWKYRYQIGLGTLVAYTLNYEY